MMYYLVTFQLKRNKILEMAINNTQIYRIKYLNKVSELKHGDSFGELSLITSKPRLATVKTNGPCEFATLSKETYQNTLGKLQEEKVNAKLDELNTIPFFVEYSRAFKTRLLFCVDVLEFYKDQFIYKEGSNDK